MYTVHFNPQLNTTYQQAGMNTGLNTPAQRLYNIKPSPSEKFGLAVDPFTFDAITATLFNSFVWGIGLRSAFSVVPIVGCLLHGLVNGTKKAAVPKTTSATAKVKAASHNS